MRKDIKNISWIFQRKRLWKSLLVILSVIITAHLLFVIMVWAGTFGRLPSASELKNIRNPVATEVYSADGILMGKYYLQNREYLRPDQVTSAIRNALIATEDVRFYKHKGIDFRSLGRVLTKTLLLGDRQAGGGSTISQQLAKNLYPRKDYGLLSMPVNKLREMIIARRIENIYTKEAILELYLGTVSFGENTFGIKSGSTRFFSKDPSELRTEEAALLVGMLKATDYYNPVKNRERALGRRNVVLEQMAKYNYLDKATCDSLKDLPIELAYNPLPHYAGIAPYFREMIRKELESWSREAVGKNGSQPDIYTDGLQIFTTIDSRLQKYAEEAMKKQMIRLQELFDAQWRDRDLWKGIPEEKIFINSERPFHEDMITDSPRRMDVFTWNGSEEMEFNTLDSLKHYLHFLQAGFVAMDVSTGEIKAWIGGIDHQYYKYDHVLAKRQAGSVFKPLIYMAALESGLAPCDYFPNDSVTYAEYENWTPRNADRSYGGYYSMKGALVNSVNTVSVKLLLQTGIDSVIALGRRAGIESELPAVPSLALGSANVSLLEMVGVYQAIANHGILRDPVFIKKINDKNGNLLFENKEAESGRVVCSPANAELMIGMMKGVVDHGTASALRSAYHIEADIAGKTGTTQNYTDGWFIGFTPDLVAGVWIGGDLQNIRFRNMAYGQGAFSAMPIWAEFMKQAFSDERWGYLEKEKFRISESNLILLDCEDFSETRPFKFRPIETLREKRLLKRLFGRERRK